MAQRSKKDQIADAALLLFLEHGVKGTSVDMVVKSSGVSKPTVYNHFPDKANLISYIIERWVQQQPSPGFTARTEKGLVKELTNGWLNDTALKLYGLFMGEGFRAPEAKRHFIHHYDREWRRVLSEWAEQYEVETTQLESRVDSAIVTSLLQA